MRKLVLFTIGFAAASLAGSVLYGDWIILGAALALLIVGLLAILGRKYLKCRYAGAVRCKL